MRILDWELTALQARYASSDLDLKAAVTDNFLTKMFNPRKAPLSLSRLGGPTLPTLGGPTLRGRLVTNS